MNSNFQIGATFLLISKRQLFMATNEVKSKGVSAAFLAVALLLLAGCSSKSAFPSSVEGDVRACMKLGHFEHESILPESSYLGELQDVQSKVVALKRARDEFSSIPGRLAQTESDSIAWQIESLVAENFREAAPGTTAYAADLILRIKYSTDSRGVYRIQAENTAGRLRSLVSTACGKLEREYPISMFELK